jgi:nucleoside phosphorylase
MTRPFDAPLGPHRDTSDIHIGIVTALPVEYAAVEALLDTVSDQPVKQDPHHYRSGSLPSKDPDRPHRVVVALQARDGTRAAASTCTDMVRSFPGLRVFVICGIAGGIPAPHDPRRGVRLGDVVVASDGIVDFGHVRRIDGVDSLRRGASGISATLLRADRELQVMALGGDEPWLGDLEAAAALNDRFGRPATTTDPLHRQRAATAAGGAGARLPGASTPQPRVWHGMVGSSDILLRDAAFRDRLAVEHNVIAVEMESAGITAAAESHDRHWFGVRGISDYCDNGTKNDVWHGYAALAAAAYLRGLLAVCPPFGSTAGASWAPAGGSQEIVDTLLKSPAFADDHQRRAVLAELPERIRTAVPESVVPRIHVVGLVRTCRRDPGGREALLDALRLVLGPASADYEDIQAVIDRHWPETS